jgi:hypothetical protein
MGTILDLRKLLAERFQQPPPPPPIHLSTGVPGLDHSLGGGLPKSAITEVTSPRVSAGSALLVYALLDNARRNGYFLALIDGGDSFDPQSLDQKLLRHLLWVRCTRAIDAVKAADLLLRDGNFPLVILDLVLSHELRKIPQTTWYRLQRLVEAVPTAFLVLTRKSIISSAEIKLSLINSWRLSDLQQDHQVDRLQVELKRVHTARELIAKAS